MKQAIILAAGEGRRLKPFTMDKPKAMLSIAGKPILRYVIEALAGLGIRRIIIVVGYQKESVYDYVGDGKQLGVDVDYVVQHKQLGTGHALYEARNEAESEFLVLGGNKLILPETIAGFIHATPPAILIKKVDNPTSYGVINVKDNRLVSIIEKPVTAESSFINAGIYSFNERIFNYLESHLDLPDAINAMLEQDETVNLVETDRTWLDVVYPWDILTLNSILLKNSTANQSGIIESGVQMKGQVSIGRDTIIRSNSYIVGPVTIGKGCEIGPGVCIFPATSIGDNVMAGPFSEIRNSVIGSDISIASNSTIQDSVIDSGCVIGSHFSAITEETEAKADQEHHLVKVGSMLGRSCRIGNSVIALPGTVIGNYCQIKSLKLLNGIVPDRSIVV